MDKKVNKIFNALTIYAFSLVMIGILGTFLSDYLVSINWFNDPEPYMNRYGIKSEPWGARHYWYNWGIGLLFVLSTARVVFLSISLIDKTYKD